MSALPPKADIGTHSWNVRFVPKADSCSAANNAKLRNTPLLVRGLAFSHRRSSMLDGILARLIERDDDIARRDADSYTRGRSKCGTFTEVLAQC
jgi:hypothetical protein